MIGRNYRFHGYNSLNFAYRHGQTTRSAQLALRYSLNPRRSQFRVAVVVSRKVHKSAVTRNRIRRRVYEAIRAEQPLISAAYDLVFTVYGAQLADIEHVALQKQVHELLEKAGVITGKKPPSSPKSISQHDIVVPKD